MCGIAGFLGTVRPSDRSVECALGRMRQRGPDLQTYASYAVPGEQTLLLLHSRLSILDLDPRSNQPFEEAGCSLVFNGEIYNYLELRQKLEQRGVVFRTESDTEVLLKTYLEFGEQGLEQFEGMWAFALWDRRRAKLLLSRDRFGEKPLYLWFRPEGVYFASETAILRELPASKPDVNRRQIVRYLAQGYKALYKHRETFYEGVQEFPAGHYGWLDSDRIQTERFWIPQWKANEAMTLEEAIEGTRERLLESVRLRLRSDVPLAFCLSGGVDSAALVSIAAKEFGVRPAVFSIIDQDERYNERDNIEATVADTGVDAHYLEVSRDHTLDRLRALVRYHDAPVATITFFVHSMISEAVAQSGCRVVFSGTSADELFTGYYDHYLLHLQALEGRDGYDEALQDWQTHILRFVRNPILQNPRLYTEQPSFREHVYDHVEEFLGFLQADWRPEPFSEENYTTPMLRNRMLNELFHEATPVILHEDDLNSMFYSLENRSPYLDSRLFAFAGSIPTRHLIRDGYAKFVLREAVKGILNEQVRLDRRKKGFNASINSVFDLRCPEFRSWLLEPSSELASILDMRKLEKLLDLESAPNHYSKFLFNVINARIFLE